VSDALVRPSTNIINKENFLNKHISEYFYNNWTQNLKKNQNYFQTKHLENITLKDKNDFLKRFLSKYHFNETQSNLQIFETYNSFFKIDLLKANHISSYYVLKRTDRLFLYLKYCNMFRNQREIFFGGFLSVKMLYPPGLSYQVKNYYFDSKSKLRQDNYLEQKAFIPSRELHGKCGTTIH
jgi:hypothetical protein